MRCVCGAEIPAGSKYCRKCGKIVSELPKSHCWKCGCQLYPKAKYCGKCGAPQKNGPVSRCTKCGKIFAGAGPLCDSCRTAESDAGSWIKRIHKKLEPARRWMDSRVADNIRARKLAIVALVVGLCIAFSGLAGKIVMGELSSNIQKSEIFTQMDLATRGILSRSVGNAMIGLFVDVIRNDPSGFISTMKQVIEATGSMAGDPYGANSLVSHVLNNLTEDSVKEGFSNIRSLIMQKAGAYWPLLQAMAYYRELLTIGLIIAFAAAVLWFLLGGRFYDVITLRMIPALCVGAGWTVLMIVGTVIGSLALR